MNSSFISTSRTNLGCSGLGMSWRGNTVWSECQTGLICPIMTTELLQNSSYFISNGIKFLYSTHFHEKRIFGQPFLSSWRNTSSISMLQWLLHWKKNMRLYCIVIKVQFAIISKFALGYYRFLCHCVPKKYIINNNYCYYHYYLLPASPCENKKQTSEMKLVISSHRLGDWITVNSQLDEECWCHISTWSSSLLEQFWKKKQ